MVRVPAKFLVNFFIPHLLKVNKLRGSEALIIHTDFFARIHDFNNYVINETIFKRCGIRKLIITASQKSGSLSHGVKQAPIMDQKNLFFLCSWRFGISPRFHRAHRSHWPAAEAGIEGYFGLNHCLVCRKIASETRESGDRTLINAHIKTFQN
jgi:hypothetical protein